MGEVPVGTWESSFGEIYTITRSSISYAGSADAAVSWTASIVYVDDSRLNGGDTFVTASGDSSTDEPAVNPGFAVIRYESVADASYGEEGRYNVFRWADGATAGEREMTQGGKYEGTWGEDDYRMVVFNTVDEAISGATNEAGFFGFSSTVTLQE